MSFYLLKSTYERRKVGDVLIDLTQVESIVVSSKEKPDSESKVYTIAVTLRSNDTCRALYNKREEAEKVVKEILGDKVDDKTLAEIMF